MAGERRKKKRKVRDKDWAERHEEAFTHDLKRHRRTDTAISEAAPTPDVPEDFEANGLVISHSKKWAFVQWDNRGEGERTREPQGQGRALSRPHSKADLCRISEHLLERGATILAPGDNVLVEAIEGDPWVRAVAPRTSKLSRPGGEHARVAQQVFAANIDVLVVVAAAAKPAFRPGLVDRYLIAAEVGGVTPILCLNKLDLVDSEPPELEAYRSLGIKVICTSCKTGEGLDELREALRGKLSVFAGHSGVGKSSLLNSLQPGLDLATREISEATQRGKHTTSTARLYELDDGLRIIDTPGIRQLGLWGVSPEEVAFYFPEIAEHAEACKFRDCTHTHEPDCAVRQAVDVGQLPRLRFESYLRIREGLEEQAPRR
jgi:ribosome biogenesis GTPase